MWACFLLEPIGQASLSLRRFTWSKNGKCPAQPYDYGHDASVLIGRAPLVLTPEGYIASLPNPAPSDPRWPKQCTCGYVFQDTDERQHNQRPLYRAPDGQEYTIHPGDAPVGAMWDAPWLIHDAEPWIGPDGRCLMVRLPDGTDWTIDGPSRSGGRWTRTGDPPLITVRPSILSTKYHGWLTDGVLSDDLEGRQY